MFANATFTGGGHATASREARGRTRTGVEVSRSLLSARTALQRLRCPEETGGGGGGVRGSCLSGAIEDSCLCRARVTRVVASLDLVEFGVAFRKLRHVVSRVDSDSQWTKTAVKC